MNDIGFEKKNMLVFFLILSIILLEICSCDDAIEQNKLVSDGSVSNPKALSLNISTPCQIAANDVAFYTFFTASEGTYTIDINSFASKSVILPKFNYYLYADKDFLLGQPFVSQEGYFLTVPNLINFTRYYLKIINNDNIDLGYNIIISRELFVPVNTEIIEHKASSIGMDIPEWLRVYRENGNNSIEALVKFEDYYVFVAENSGTDINSLRLWDIDFDVSQDFSLLVNRRIQSRLAFSSSFGPDLEFGCYYENLINCVSEKIFTGARKESSFWLFVRYYKPDGITEDYLIYDYYILFVIEKTTFKTQLNQIFDSIVIDKPLSSEQQNAVDSIRESFFDGF